MPPRRDRLDQGEVVEAPLPRTRACGRARCRGRSGAKSSMLWAIPQRAPGGRSAQRRARPPCARAGGARGPAPPRRSSSLARAGSCPPRYPPSRKTIGSLRVTHRRTCGQSAAPTASASGRSRSTLSGFSQPPAGPEPRGMRVVVQRDARLDPEPREGRDPLAPRGQRRRRRTRPGRGSMAAPLDRVAVGVGADRAAGARSRRASARGARAARRSARRGPCSRPTPSHSVQSLSAAPSIW